MKLGAFHKLRLHFLVFFDQFALLIFLTTYPPLSANVICESSPSSFLGAYVCFTIFEIPAASMIIKVCSSYGRLAYFSNILNSGKKLYLQYRKDNIFARSENIGKICKQT